MNEWDKLVEEAQTAVTHAFEAADKMADRRVVLAELTSEGNP